MSAEEGPIDEKAEKSPRRRRTNANIKPAKESKSDEVVEPVAETSAPSERVYIETAPIPLELVGFTVAGRISDFDIRRKGKFGFINIGESVGTKPDKDTPRIYFRLKDYAEKGLLPRRGYNVLFKVNKEEAEDRFFASEIVLTEESKAQATEDKAKRSAALAAKREVKVSAAADPTPASAAEVPAVAQDSEPVEKTEEKKTNRKRSSQSSKRKANNHRELNLLVKLESAGVVKELTVSPGRLLGALKRDVAVLFEEPGDFVMHAKITEENPKGEFLTKKILRGLKTGDTILLLEAPQAAAAAVAEENA